MSQHSEISKDEKQNGSSEDEKWDAGSKVTLKLKHKVIRGDGYVDESKHFHGDLTLEPSDVTLIKRLNLSSNDNPYRQFDERRHQIREKMKQKFKEAPKSLMEIALENKTKLEKTLEDTDKKMSDLLGFGNELVSNIKVANEKRELLRREYENNRRIDLENDLKKESVQAMARYEEIKARWTELDGMKEPMTLFDQMEEQKQRILELMESKDAIIAQCQREIDRMNESYDYEQRRQYDDLCCMVERIDNQVELLRQANNHQLTLLERTIEEERKTMALSAANKFNHFFKRMEDGENHKLDVLKEKKEFYGNEFERIIRQQDEITRATRIRLEKDAEMLEWEVRNIKNQVLMNTEKLDYNYQVLQKRNDENVIVNNQQKRRIGKLKEGISELKRRIATSRTKAEATVQKLSSDIQKLHVSISELEKKRLNFRLANKKKFYGVWDINFQEVKELISKVLEIDRILHEQQLNMPWQQPELDLREHPEVLKMRKMRTDESGLNFASRIDSTRGLTMSTICKTTALCTPSARKSVAKRKDERNTAAIAEKRLNVRFLRNILRHISDRSGFLVEEKLMEILKPYTDEQKTLVRIDNIFDALRIQDMKTINILLDNFKPYAWCPNCMSGMSKQQLCKIYSVDEKSLGGNKSDDNGTAAAAAAVGRDGSMIASSAASSSSSTQVSRVSTKTGSTTPSDYSVNTNCSNHYLAIEPAFVLTALNDFTLKQTQQQQKKHLGRSAAKDADVSGDLNKINLIDIHNDAIDAYWQKFTTYIPENMLRLWSTLEHGMTHYLEVLKKREQLDAECSALRRQNEELKFLLQKINTD